MYQQVSEPMIYEDLEPTTESVLDGDFSSETTEDYE